MKRGGCISIRFPAPHVLLVEDTLHITYKLTPEGIVHVGTTLNGIELDWEYGRANGVTFLTESELSDQEHRNDLIAYLKAKTEMQDWHGVSDAANDLRELEAELSCLMGDIPERTRTKW